MRELGSHRVFAKQLVVGFGTGAAVAILVGDGDQTFVEKRVALTRHLHPGTKLLRTAIPGQASCFIAQYSYLTAAGSCIDANNLLVTAQFGDRNHQRHEVDVEPALRVLARRTKLQEIEYGQDVGIETIVTLACECEVTAAQVLDCLRGVTIQLSFRGDAVLRGIAAVVALIIKRSGNTLVVWRNGARSEQRTMIMLVMVHFRNAVGLYQVLISVSDVVDHPEVRLQNRIPVSERRVVFELVAERRCAESNVVPGGNVNLIEHVVIEVVLVRSDAGLFVWVHAQRGDKTLHSVFVLYERVNVGGVGRRIANDQRRILVTGGLRRSN